MFDSLVIYVPPFPNISFWLPAKLDSCITGNNFYFIAGYDFHMQSLWKLLQASHTLSCIGCRKDVNGALWSGCGEDVNRALWSLLAGRFRDVAFGACAVQAVLLDFHQLSSA